MRKFVLTMSVIAAAAVAAASPAAAEERAPRETVTFQNYVTGASLDAHEQRPASRAYPNNCQGSNYQQWEVRQLGPVVVYENVALELCLTAERAPEVWAVPCNYGDQQQHWVRDERNPGKIQSAVWESQVITHKQGGIWLEYSSTDPRQLWYSED